MPTKSNAAPQGFTPGPWRAHRSVGGWIDIRTDDDGTEGACAIVAKVLDDGSMSNADAALIASAPALLAENERLRGALEAYENAWHKFKDAPTEDCFTDEEKNALCDLGNASSLARATLAGGAR